jgi:hypothetical protein
LISSRASGGRTAYSRTELTEKQPFLSPAAVALLQELLNIRPAKRLRRHDLFCIKGNEVMTKACAEQVLLVFELRVQPDLFTPVAVSRS